jgi:putative addiction module component (TIGR02574 family)
VLAEFESLRHLSVAEKLEVIGMLWRDIETSDEELPISDDVLREVERRVIEFQNSPTETFPREDLWKRVDARRG